MGQIKRKGLYGDRKVLHFNGYRDGDMSAHTCVCTCSKCTEMPFNAYAWFELWCVWELVLCL